jgi:hypothetical protein
MISIEMLKKVKLIQNLFLPDYLHFKLTNFRNHDTNLL